MSRARIEVPQLENMVGAGKKEICQICRGSIALLIRITYVSGDRKGSECGIQSETLCVGKHGKSGRISGKFL